jgi:hypothetical protein
LWGRWRIRRKKRFEGCARLKSIHLEEEVHAIGRGWGEFVRPIFPLYDPDNLSIQFRGESSIKVHLLFAKVPSTNGVSGVDEIKVERIF